MFACFKYSLSHISFPGKELCLTSDPLADLQGATTPFNDVTSHRAPKRVCVVPTRAGATRMKGLHSLIVPCLQPLKVKPAEFTRLRGSCTSLAIVRAKASAGQTEVARNGASYKFSWVNGLLYREHVTSMTSVKLVAWMLVAPDACRNVVIHVAHDRALAGHLSRKKIE